MYEKDILTFKLLIKYIKDDLDRCDCDHSFLDNIYCFLCVPGFKYSIWLRLSRYFWMKGLLFFPAFLLSRFILKHYSYKYNFDISYRTSIGSGLRISHHGYILINGGAVIGNNCSLRPGVVIGNAISREGAAHIGNNVDIGVGAKIIGAVNIGNNVIIGANAVVTKDIPDNAIVAGVPAKVIRYIEEKKI